MDKCFSDNAFVNPIPILPIRANDYCRFLCCCVRFRYYRLWVYEGERVEGTFTGMANYIVTFRLLGVQIRLLALAYFVSLILGYSTFQET